MTHNTVCDKIGGMSTIKSGKSLLGYSDPDYDGIECLLFTPYCPAERVSESWHDLNAKFGYQQLEWQKLWCVKDSPRQESGLDNEHSFNRT